MLRPDRVLAPRAVPPEKQKHSWRRPAFVAGLALLLTGTAAGVGFALSSSNSGTAMPAPRTPSATTASASIAAAAAASASPAGSATTIPSAQALPQPTHATTQAPQNTTVTPKLLGAPNFNGYCQATGQGSVTLTANNAYGWHCANDNGTGDDAEAVCKWTFNTTKVTNRVANFNDPNSWQCWRANRELGALDFNVYCRSLGFSGAYTVPARNAYGWYCTGSTAALDSQAACAAQYGNQPPISRFQNFYDLNSWQCWG